MLDASPLGKTTFLQTDSGKPYTSNGFGNWFRGRCDEAGLPHCSAHGLRKAAATRLAEAGASEHEIMAITGHTTSKEVSRYTKASRQKVLAEQAFDRFKKEGETEIIVPLLEAEKSGGTKPTNKLLKNNDLKKKIVPRREIHLFPAANKSPLRAARWFSQLVLA